MHKPNNAFVSAVCGRLIEDPGDKRQVGLGKVSVGKHPVLWQSSLMMVCGFYGRAAGPSSKEGNVESMLI